MLGSTHVKSAQFVCLLCQWRTRVWHRHGTVDTFLCNCLETHFLVQWKIWCCHYRNTFQLTINLHQTYITYCVLKKKTFCVGLAVPDACKFVSCARVRNWQHAHPSFVNISPTLVIDTSMERSSRVLHHGNSKFSKRSKFNFHIFEIIITLNWNHMSTLARYFGFKLRSPHHEKFPISTVTMSQ